MLAHTLINVFHFFWVFHFIEIQLSRNVIVSLQTFMVIHCDMPLFIACDIESFLHFYLLVYLYQVFFIYFQFSLNFIHLGLIYFNIYHWLDLYFVLEDLEIYHYIYLIHHWVFSEFACNYQLPSLSCSHCVLHVIFSFILRLKKNSPWVPTDLIVFKFLWVCTFSGVSFFLLFYFFPL